MMGFSLSSAPLPGVRYKANGFVEAVKYANGITTSFTDDGMGRVQRISGLVYDLTYGYDGKGNVTSITGNNGTAVAASYTYYDNDWLKGATQGQKVYSYVYDAAGNCTSKTVNGAVTSYGYDPKGLNLLTSVKGKAVAHDSRGNMTEKTEMAGTQNIKYGYTYNQSNQMTNVLKNSQDIGAYYYNSEGKRYRKVENGQSTYYVYSGEILLYELKPDGTVVYYVYLNGKQIAKVEGNRKYFYHTDHLGSTRAITDEQGNVVGRFEYEPFGAEESQTGQDDTLTFTGKMEDEPTGLMYFNARYYDPALGRFMTEDPVKDEGNWYVYCENKPLKFFNPSGNVTEYAFGIEGMFAGYFKYEISGVTYISHSRQMNDLHQWNKYVQSQSNNTLLTSGLAVVAAFFEGVAVLTPKVHVGVVASIAAATTGLAIKSFIDSLENKYQTTVDTEVTDATTLNLVKIEMNIQKSMWTLFGWLPIETETREYFYLNTIIVNQTGRITLNNISIRKEDYEMVKKVTLGSGDIVVSF